MRAAIRTPQAIIGLIVVGVFLVLALFSRFLAPHSTSEPSCAVFEPPSGAHWLGCDDGGNTGGEADARTAAAFYELPASIPPGAPPFRGCWANRR